MIIGHKHTTEAMDFILNYGMVGEHSSCVEAVAASYCGAARKANVGISNDNAGEKPAHRKTKVS